VHRKQKDIRSSSALSSISPVLAHDDRVPRAEPARTAGDAPRNGVAVRDAGLGPHPVSDPTSRCGTPARRAFRNRPDPDAMAVHRSIGPDRGAFNSRRIQFDAPPREPLNCT
jgi:hypothetical protein